jgi:hypothetical protein
MRGNERRRVGKRYARRHHHGSAWRREHRRRLRQLLRCVVPTFGFDHGSARRNDVEQRQRELCERRLPELARYDRSTWRSIVVIGFEQLHVGNVHAHLDAPPTTRRQHDDVIERDRHTLTKASGATRYGCEDGNREEPWVHFDCSCPRDGDALPRFHADRRALRGPERPKGS